MKRPVGGGDTVVRQTTEHDGALVVRRWRRRSQDRKLRTQPNVDENGQERSCWNCLGERNPTVVVRDQASFRRLRNDGAKMAAAARLGTFRSRQRVDENCWEDSNGGGARRWVERTAANLTAEWATATS
ncbi:UNVERIFIED_CONTAM: hypothetical protein Sindi_1355300 [Sesamum indicum]